MSRTAYKSEALRIWWITAYFLSSSSVSRDVTGREGVLEDEGASSVATCGPCCCGNEADEVVGDAAGDE